MLGIGRPLLRRTGMPKAGRLESLPHGETLSLHGHNFAFILSGVANLPYQPKYQ